MPACPAKMFRFRWHHDLARCFAGTSLWICAQFQSLRSEMFPHNSPRSTNVESIYRTTLKYSTRWSLLVLRKFSGNAAKEKKSIQKLLARKPKNTNIFIILRMAASNNGRKTFANAAEETGWRLYSLVDNIVASVGQLQLQQHQIACGGNKHVTNRWNVQQFIEFLAIKNSGLVNREPIMGNRWPIPNITGRRNWQAWCHLLSFCGENSDQWCFVSDVTMRKCQFTALAHHLSTLWRSQTIGFRWIKFCLFILPHQQFSTIHCPCPAVTRTIYRNECIPLGKCKRFVHCDWQWQSKWLHDVVFGTCDYLIRLDWTTRNAVPAKIVQKMLG